LLARQPLGYDEDFTAAAIARPFGEMLSVVGHDSAPPLFYAPEWLVAQVAGGPAALRLVPALAGIALIPLLAALARRVGGDRAGLWAAAFAAVLPATLLGSENARMYSQAGALVVASILLAWRATERPSAGRWLAYAVVAGAAVWTDYFAAVALAGVLLAVAWLRPGRRALTWVTAATGAAFASVGLWLLAAPDQLSHAGQGFWIPPLSPGSILGTAGQLFAGPPVDSGVPFQEGLIALQVVAVVAGTLALAGMARAWPGLSDPGRRAAGFCLVACGGVIALAAVSVWRPILEARYAGVMWLPLFALAGVGLAAMPRRAAGALLVAVAVPALALGTVITHPETALLPPEFESRMGPHDLVAADPNHYLLLWADGDSRFRAQLHVLAASDPPWYFGTAAYPEGAVVRSVPADVSAAGGTVFWIADPGSAPPSLPAGYRQTSQLCAIRVCLTTFRPGA
jgi:mannosyltransferase